MIVCECILSPDVVPIVVFLALLVGWGVGAASAAGRNAEGTSEVLCQERVPLEVGRLHVVDEFVKLASLKQFRKILKRTPMSLEKKLLNASFENGNLVPPADAPTMRDIMQKVQRYVQDCLDISNSSMPQGPWKSVGGLVYPDHYALRRYRGPSRQLEPHMDTGMYGRCLSSVLYISKDAVKGGNLVSMRCHDEACSGFHGWQWDPQHFPSPPLSAAGALDEIDSAAPKPGRLVVLLGDTVHAVREVISGRRDVIFMWFTCKPTLLNGAVRNGDPKVVQQLVEARAEVSERHPYTGTNALHVAAKGGHAEITRFLVEQGSDVGLVDYELQNPIHVMSSRPSTLSVLATLVSARAEVSKRDHSGMTPLHRFVNLLGDPHGVDNTEVVRYFLEEAQADPCAKILPHKGTALHLAAMHLLSDVVQILVSAGTDLSARDANNFTPLDMARFGMHEKGGSPETIAYLERFTQQAEDVKRHMSLKSSIKIKVRNKRSKRVWMSLLLADVRELFIGQLDGLSTKTISVCKGLALRVREDLSKHSVVLRKVEIGATQKQVVVVEAGFQHDSEL